MKLERSDGYATQSLSSNKFCALLKDNLLRDYNRRRMCNLKQSNMQSKTRTRLLTQEFEQKNLVLSKNPQKVKLSKAFDSLCTSQDIVSKQTFSRRSSLTNFKETFRENGKNAVQFAPPDLAVNSKEVNIKSFPQLPFQRPVKYLNFCDYYDKSIQIVSTDELSVKRKAKCYAVDNSNHIEKRQTCQPISSKKHSLKDIVNQRKTVSFIDPEFYVNFKYENPIKKKSNFALKGSNSLAKFSPSKSKKVAKEDSSFLNQYFRFKDDLYNRSRNSVFMDKNLVNNVNSFIISNYKSYWMSSVDFLLSQKPINKIANGYYEFHSITSKTFKPMSSLEMIIFRLEKDIRRERIVLFR